MLFSIVVPIYNIDKYLQECLDSILKQSYRDFEVVLVNDGSTDKCYDICEQYRSNPKVRIIHKENGGLVSARKAGSSIASGQYIVCVDGDDYLDLDYLKNLEPVITSLHPDIIFCDYYESHEKGKKKVTNQYSEGFYQGTRLNEIADGFLYDADMLWPNRGRAPYSIWSKVVKRELYCECQLDIPDSLTLGEDLAVVSLILKKANSVYISKISGYNYRIINTSMSHHYNSNNISKIENTILFLRNRIGDIQKANVHALNSIDLQVNLMFRDSGSYIEFKRKITTFYRSTVFQNAVNEACIKRAKFKNRIKVFWIKKHITFLIYLYYKIVNVVGR